MDLATQSGWDHEDARKKMCGRLCVFDVFIVLLKSACSSLESLLQTQTHRQHVQSPSLAPRHLLTLSDLFVISLL